MIVIAQKEKGGSMRRRVLVVMGVSVLGIAGLLAAHYVRNSGTGDVLVASGTVEVTEVDLGFKIPGRIARLTLDEGQEVAKGELLAALDDAELRSVVDQGRAQVRHAEADMERAARDFDRASELAGQGVVSSQQLDGATRNRAVARSQLDIAQAGLRAARVRLSDAVLSSPLSGVVLERSAEPGETVAAGRTVYTIGNLDAPWIRVYVRENKLGLVKLGQSAEVSVDSFPGKIYQGTVSHIASEAEFTPKNVQTREERVKLVFGVKVNVRNENGELKPGMPADVKISVK